MYALVGVFGGVLLYKLARVRRKNETVEKVVIGEPELLQLAKSCLIKVFLLLFFYFVLDLLLDVVLTWAFVREGGILSS